MIWATGRVPHTEGLNLEAAGVELTERGFIKVNEFQETTAEGVYALGDVSGEKELTPVAIKAGRTLAERLFNGQQTRKWTTQRFQQSCSHIQPLEQWGFQKNKP